MSVPILDKMRENKLKWLRHDFRRDEKDSVRIVKVIYVEGRWE